MLGDGRPLEVGLHLVDQAERARGGIDHDRQPTAVGPAPQVLDDGVGHVAVPAVVALGVPDGPAAQPGHVVRDPHGPPRALRQRHHHLRQARPLGQGLRVAEDPVDARGEVDRRRTRADRSPAASRGAERGISGSHRGDQVAADDRTSGIRDPVMRPSPATAPTPCAVRTAIRPVRSIAGSAWRPSGRPLGRGPCGP